MKFKEGDIAVYINEPPSRYNGKRVLIRSLLEGYTPRRWAVKWIDLDTGDSFSGENEDNLVLDIVYNSPLYKALG